MDSTEPGPCRLLPREGAAWPLTPEEQGPALSTMTAGKRVHPERNPLECAGGAGQGELLSFTSSRFAWKQQVLS